MTSDVLFVRKKRHVTRHKITPKGIVIRYLNSYVLFFIRKNLFSRVGVPI
jgi:hypothetical protein